MPSALCRSSQNARTGVIRGGIPVSVSSIDWLSAVLLLMLAADFIVGFRRGLMRQVIDFAGIILAILAAMRYWKPVAALLERWFSALNPPASNMVGFLAVLIAALVVVDLLGHALRSWPRRGVSLVNGFGGPCSGWPGMSAHQAWFSLPSAVAQLKAGTRSCVHLNWP